MCLVLTHVLFLLIFSLVHVSLGRGREHSMFQFIDKETEAKEAK